MMQLMESSVALQFWINQVFYVVEPAKIKEQMCK